MLNSIELELLWRRLISVVDEAAASLVRTSFSSIVRESNDFACVIADVNGRAIAQASNSIPSFIGTVPRTIRSFLEIFPESELEEGDVLITNDIWLGTGHLPDITVAKPIFYEGKIVAWAGSVAHSPDIGGRIRSADATSVYEEGFQIPPMKVLSAGQINKTLESLLRKNVRVPDQVMGDLYAQFTGLSLMERQVLLLMREYKLEDIEELSSELRSRSEKAMRNAIRSVPDGVYYTQALSDGIDKPICLKMALTIDDDEIRIDFAGSDLQIQKSINVCLAYTIAYTSFGIKAVLCPDVPNNDGTLVPLTIAAPLGSILNSTPPAPGGARALIGHFLPAMVLAALSDAVPDKVIAGIGSPLWGMNLGGVLHDGTGFTNLFFLNGGYGASSSSDGINVLSWPSNVSSTPVEVIEQLSPLKVHFRQFRKISAANGMYRGGSGQEIKIESTNPTPITISFLAERTKPQSTTPGLKGGQNGQAGEVLINGVAVNPKQQHLIEEGTVVVLRTPGGGGYGAVNERSSSAILEDVKRGFI